MRNWRTLPTHLGTSIGLPLLACVIGLSGCRSMVFHPVQNEPTLRQRYESNRFEIASHGQTIEGWQLENPGAHNDMVVLYFGERAGAVRGRAGCLRVRGRQGAHPERIVVIGRSLGSGV